LSGYGDIAHLVIRLESPWILGFFEGCHHLRDDFAKVKPNLSEGLQVLPVPSPQFADFQLLWLERSEQLLKALVRRTAFLLLFANHLVDTAQAMRLGRFANFHTHVSSLFRAHFEHDSRRVIAQGWVYNHPKGVIGGSDATAFIL
jgi:hypothetical protein